MTSKLTREQLHERARENVKALKLASRQTAFESARKEILADLQLAEIALAAMDSEPVIVVGDDGGDALSYRRLIQSFEPGTKLYRHAQPAPVVPEEMTPEMMRSVQLNSELGAYAASNLSGAYDLFAEFWKEACRAAMLAAATQSPGSDPATVPGKWIPVSEQMPDVGVKVLCFPAKDEPIHATFNGQLWLQDVSWSGSEEPIDNVIPVTVTHWMPLPAAPQEVK